MSYRMTCSTWNWRRSASVSTASESPQVGAECADQAVSGRVVEHDLEAVAVRLGGRLAPDRARDCLLEPDRHSTLIGVRRRPQSGRSRCPRDLALERSYRPAALRRLASQHEPTVMVRLGEQDLAVAFGERPRV